MGLIDAYNYYIWEYPDQRTNNWFLVGSPWPVITILSSYLYFVLQEGPRNMAKREAYSLKKFIQWYNIFQIFINAWVVYTLLEAGWFTTIGVGCELVDYSMDPSAVKITKAMYIVYLVKIIDLLETGMFVLRKKDEQISTLHLYHHMSTALMAWGTVKWVPGGMAMFSTLLNSFVHVIMYTYYFLTTQGKTWQGTVTFIKPYITIIQMVQFAIMIIHTVQVFLPSCNFSKKFALTFVLNVFINFYFFYNFYKKNYIQSKKRKNKT